MSWSFSLRTKDAELDTKLKEAIRGVGAAKENPASARAMARIQEHGLAALQHAPKDSIITVESYGHYDANGEGSHAVKVSVETAEAIAQRSEAEKAAEDRKRANDEVAAENERRAIAAAEAERIRLANEAYGHTPEVQGKPEQPKEDGITDDTAAVQAAGTAGAPAIPQVAGVDQDAPQ